MGRIGQSTSSTPSFWVTHARSEGALVSASLRWHSSRRFAKFSCRYGPTCVHAGQQQRATFFRALGL
eukprot:2770949-Pyramimonas_sp.AAC.1